MSYALIWESKSSIWCRFSGRVDFADVTMATNEFYHDHRSDNIRVTLWDFTEISDFVIDENEATEIAATDAAASVYLKPLKAAFITQNSEFALLVEQYIRDKEQFGSPWTNKLFRTIGEARNWVATATD